MYGADSRVVDVTDYVRRALADDPYAPLQPDGPAYGDPAPSMAQGIGGQLHARPPRKTANIAEGEVLPLPALPSSGAVVKGAAVDFRILAAQFGRWADVAGRDRRRPRKNRRTRRRHRLEHSQGRSVVRGA